jgi:uncharacterized cupin superfamily protein
MTSRRIDLSSIQPVIGTGYPPPFDEPCLARRRLKLGDAAGLTQFGVNLLTLKPGVWSSQRHWHSHEDEFVYVVSGEVVMVTDAGEEVLRAGDAAGFKAGEPDGHHLQNRSGADAVVLEVGTRMTGVDGADYPDIDMIVRPGKGFTRKDGTPYPKAERRGA